MKNLLLIILSLGLLQSCRVKTGSGNIQKEERKVSAFTKLSVGGSFNVEIRPGSAYKLTIAADDNILEDIETAVSGGKLNIEFRDGVNVNNADVKVYIELPVLQSLEASASASIKITGVLRSEGEIRFEASSSGSIEGEIDAPATEINASSAGTIVLKGRTKNLKAESDSGASIEAGELLSETARAEASSGASVQLHASLKLDAEASSGGSINYRGNPTVTKDENSGGSVSKVE